MSMPITKKHLVTAGCSFTDNTYIRWPQILAERTEMSLYNMGQASCGNDYIAGAFIHHTLNLLNNGVKPEEMLAIIMWSGIDRVAVHIDPTTPKWNQLMGDSVIQENPATFLSPYRPNKPSSKALVKDANSGFIVGSMNCYFENHEIMEYKNNYVFEYRTNESLAYASINNWLRVQWFCEQLGIELVNLTYMSTWYYPRLAGGPGTTQPIVFDNFELTKPLKKLINMDRWWFTNDKYGGAYEWQQANTNLFEEDNFHPSAEGHAHYVDHYLLPKLKEQKLL